MKTPIYDFVRGYASSGAARMHMPGHKGVGSLGEAYDITEISGADSLYEADGIIRESEGYASELFGAHTFYSTEGSSLSIRAMLYLTCLYARERGERPFILVGRNAHRAFISAAALLDFELGWLRGDGSYLCCQIDAERLRERLSSEERLPTAVYITSPDYLGGVADVEGIARVCHDLGVLLLVDNAHGAYLKFLPSSRHPMDLGADMCCDSAHKTLPTLTGGAYLHVSRGAPSMLAKRAKEALALFGSTSPSYLILSSLDLTNKELSGDFKFKLSTFIDKTAVLRKNLTDYGYELYGDEPLKITVLTKSFGYPGTEMMKILGERGVVCEFADPDYLVLMLTPRNSDEELDTLCRTMLSVPRKAPVLERPPFCVPAESAMTVREAMTSDSVELDIGQARGYILSSASVACPPAVAVLVAGEIITDEAVRAMQYYGVRTVRAIKR